MGGARLFWGFSWNTSNGASICYKNARKIAISYQTRHCSNHIGNILTIPFRSPHLIRSRTRLCVSQRAEKFTTAQRSIFVGCTNFCTKCWKYHKNHWIKIKISKKKKKKKRKYLVVEIPSTIPRKEILPIAHFQLLRKQENKGKFD